jgi:hypothetical protein
MRPLADKTAPSATVDDAVLMNSLLDIGGILLLSRVRDSILDHEVKSAPAAHWAMALHGNDQ